MLNQKILKLKIEMIPMTNKIGVCIHHGVYSAMRFSVCADSPVESDSQTTLVQEHGLGDATLKCGRSLSNLT